MTTGIDPNELLRNNVKSHKNGRRITTPNDLKQNMYIQ